MDLGLAGRRAAVAGASSGLGYAVAEALVGEGVAVAICGRDAARSEAAARALGPLATPLVADVSTPEGAAGFVDDAIRALGGVDILVPNAGGPPAGTFASTPLEAYEPALRLSLLSTVAMCQVAVPPMRERRFGRIVAITSVSVRQPYPFLILSNTARAGVTGFLKTLALEVAADGVTVNALQPGYHATARVTSLFGAEADPVALGVPAGRLGDPAAFGLLAAMLASEHASFVTGANLPVDGGQYQGLL